MEDVNKIDSFKETLKQPSFNNPDHLESKNIFKILFFISTSLLIFTIIFFLVKPQDKTNIFTSNQSEEKNNTESIFRDEEETSNQWEEYPYNDLFFSFEYPPNWNIAMLSDPFKKNEENISYSVVILNEKQMINTAPRGGMAGDIEIFEILIDNPKKIFQEELQEIKDWYSYQEEVSETEEFLIYHYTFEEDEVIPWASAIEKYYLLSKKEDPLAGFIRIEVGDKKHSDIVKGIINTIYLNPPQLFY